MSGELYFRVWDNNSKIMYYHNIKIDENGKFEVYDECNDCYVYNGDDKGSDLVLMQGVVGKGQKLYVGDIIRKPGSIRTGEKRFYLIEYSKEITGFVMKKLNNIGLGLNSVGTKLAICNLMLRDCEKCGNKFENPELLK